MPVANECFWTIGVTLSLTAAFLLSHITERLQDPFIKMSRAYKTQLVSIWIGLCFSFMAWGRAMTNNNEHMQGGYWIVNNDITQQFYMLLGPVIAIMLL